MSFGYYDNEWVDPDDDLTWCGSWCEFFEQDDYNQGEGWCAAYKKDVKEGGICGDCVWASGWSLA